MRKSALLRRLWARPRGPARCESRSLTGSRSELRRSPLARAAAAVAAHSDSTFQSHAGDACSCTDVFTDSETEVPPPPPPPPPPAPASLPSDDRSYSDSDPFSTSLSTAKETTAYPQELARLERFVGESIERRILERSTLDPRDDCHPTATLLYDCDRDRNRDRPLVLAVDTSAPPYELLEIVVSETVNGAGVPPPIAPTYAAAAAAGLLQSADDLDIDIDRYVSNILVESLNSLTDQLECMNASIGSDRKMSIVEKEIKVRLQNTGVNTIVHLSPTSNNQIIFGNEELCNETRTTTTTMTTTTTGRERDECNNPLIRDEPESNDNHTPLPPRPAPTSPPTSPPGFGALRHDNVNEAVLQQIQKLFRDELRHLEEDEGATSHIDVYVVREEGERTDLIGGVGAGNYFSDSRDVAVVPRFSAFPHTESMEVNTSSSEEGEPVASECTSLVDSLEDPSSPRGLASARRRALVRSAIDVLDLLPERVAPSPAPSPAPPRDKPEAFFVRIEDDRIEPDPDDVRVAEYMPEKIKQRLYRRHRKRELRIECERRGKVTTLPYPTLPPSLTYLSLVLLRIVSEYCEY